jgi:aminobenzoyl-glutamate utilization protein B
MIPVTLSRRYAMTYCRAVALTACAALLADSAAADAAATPDAAQMKQEAFAHIDAYADRMARLGDAIFSYSEIGFQEVKTVDLLTKELAAHGFTVRTGVAGMPTAYMATYGSGSPKIGLMSEYDGVPNASQKPVSFVHDPVVTGAPGHGEGHNTNQPPLLGSAFAMKAIKDKYHLPGTIVVYGGPAEELVGSRGYMAKAGLFAGLDAILHEHVSSDFGTSYGLDNFGVVSVQFDFKGRQAHAARPWQGRSALDGVELFDAGVQFMREHAYDPDDVRVQNVITKGGVQPNVVPGEASDWYYIRAKTPALVEATLAWIRDIAKGAALMSHTEVHERILAGSYPFYGNKALAEVVQKNIEAVGMPKWSADDIAFAKYKQEAMGAEPESMPTEVAALRESKQGASTSDIGDMSWLVPNVRLRIPTTAPGSLAGHHWSAALGPATPIAHKGMAAAAKALAGTMIDLYSDPTVLEAIKQDFAAQLAANPPWHSLIPDGAEPPTYLNVEEMAKYRDALQPFEYNPNSKLTYLEFLKAPYPGKEPAAGVGKASNAPPVSFDKSSLNWEWAGN